MPITFFHAMTEPFPGGLMVHFFKTLIVYLSLLFFTTQAAFSSDTSCDVPFKQSMTYGDFVLDSENFLKNFNGMIEEGGHSFIFDWIKDKTNQSKIFEGTFFQGFDSIILKINQPSSFNCGLSEPIGAYVKKSYSCVGEGIKIHLKVPGFVKKTGAERQRMSLEFNNIIAPKLEYSFLQLEVPNQSKIEVVEVKLHLNGLDKPVVASVSYDKGGFRCYKKQKVSPPFPI